MAWREKHRRHIVLTRTVKSAWFYGRAARRLFGMVQLGQDANDGGDFAVTQTNMLLDGFSLRQSVEDCYRENARRMSECDPELMQPPLLPAIAGMAVRGLRFWERSRPHLREQRDAAASRRRKSKNMAVSGRSSRPPCPIKVCFLPSVIRKLSFRFCGEFRAPPGVRKSSCGSWPPYPRQDRVAAALRELGRLERTLFTLDRIEDPELRRGTSHELNKGGSRNSLAGRSSFFGTLAISIRRKRLPRHFRDGPRNPWALGAAVRRHVSSYSRVELWGPHSAYPR